MQADRKSVSALMQDVYGNKVLSIRASYFSPDVLWYLNTLGAFAASKWNNFDGKNDVIFLLQMKNRYTANQMVSPKQENKIAAILNNVKRFLLNHGDTVQANPFEEEKPVEDKAYLWGDSSGVWEEARQIRKRLGIVEFSDLTDEQQELIVRAKRGENVLVDACIGSGKTTTIQVMCSQMYDKRILYLTYNALLKRDAKEKIHNFNTTVTNYHGFAFGACSRAGIDASRGDCIQIFNRTHPQIGRYDVLVLDEYQDIELEIAEELEYIKSQNPGIQIIAVGDMDQKIYDKTTLQVIPFIDKFLDNYKVLKFSKCFRLSEEYANRLGDGWDREIIGVNKNFSVEYVNFEDAVHLLSTCEPGDILCLGAKKGAMAEALNELEENYPEKFNKSTVYASINDEDRGLIFPDKTNAIFTTFDSSKGLERKVCVVFDYDHGYWQARSSAPMQDPKILKNIFLVAASRGKEKVVFVLPKIKERRRVYKMMTPEETKEGFETKTTFKRPFFFSEMFDFKYKEDVESCFSFLKIKKIPRDGEPIGIKGHDELIDLSHCVGIFQEADFFDDYSIDEAIEYQKTILNKGYVRPMKPDASLEDKVLYLSYLETMQERFITQVSNGFVTKEETYAIRDRLATVFKNDEEVQKHCQLSFYDEKGSQLFMEGRCDVYKDNKIYELKFVNELEHVHFLQLACYLVATGVKKGILWNTKDDEMFEVSVPKKNVKPFLDAVIHCITKGQVPEYYGTADAAVAGTTGKVNRRTAKKIDSINRKFGQAFKVEDLNDELEDDLKELEREVQLEFNLEIQPLKTAPAEETSEETNQLYDTNSPDWKFFEGILEA